MPGWLVAMVAGLLVLASPGAAQVVMYGSTSDGDFGVVDQVTGDFTGLGTPAAGIGDALSGISFDASGRLFGSVTSRSDDCCTVLIEINPTNGALIDNIGAIKDDTGADLRITDLATQPSTDRLFGLEKSGKVYSIDKTTAVATAIPGTGFSKGGIAFAPDGTLYLATVFKEVFRVDPATGQQVGQILETPECLDGLTVRPTDGVLFATECDGDGVFRIVFATSSITPLDKDDSSDTADLAFRLTTESAAPAASMLGLAVLASALVAVGYARKSRAR